MRSMALAPFRITEESMANRDVVSEKFRIALANRLKSRFGKILSAQRFSDLYNLNARGSGTISRETARLWIRGNAMPDYGHLAVLIQWLGIDPEEFLGPDNSSTTNTEKENKTNPADSRSHVTKDLIALWDQLDPETRRTVLVVAKALSSHKPKLHGEASCVLESGTVIPGKLKMPNESWQR